MCGIAGIISKNRPLSDQGRLSGILSAIKHRGPDDTGTYISEKAHLGMVRLSIIDLKSTGLCPIIEKSSNTGEDLVLVYNGELYNYIELREELKSKGHTFKTQSDSEVLIKSYKEWGSACLQRFNGMFSFAILDLEKDLLFAARDRIGEKPFYFYETENEFIFASEVKGILTQMSNPEFQFPEEFEAFEYMSGSETLFVGVQSLEPGHQLVYNGIKSKYRGKRVSEYWNVFDGIREINPERAVDELDALFQESIKLRLRSDVKMGLYLSGGIDSALIAAIAKPPIAFSVDFGHGEKYSELQYAKIMAAQIKTEHIIVQPTKEDFQNYLPKIMYHMDMPVGSLSMFPLYMLAKEASKHVKIVMSGEGSDELFSGYSRYLIMTYEEEIYKLPELTRYRPLLNYYLGSRLSRFAHLINRGNVPDATVEKLISRYFNQFSDLVHAIGYTEFKLLLPSLLQMEDRTSSAFGLENRSPFLDHRIAEFAFSLSPDLKIRGTTLKWIVREVAKRYLPKELLDRKEKMGLVFPVNEWFQYIGKRGAFDRANYTKMCVDAWKNQFFQS